MRTLYDCAVGVLYVFMYLSAVDELDGSLPEEEIDMVFEVDRPHKMRSCKEKAPALPNWRKSPTSHQISQRGAEMKKDYNLGHSWRRGRPRVARPLGGMPKISCRSSPFLSGYPRSLARPLARLPLRCLRSYCSVLTLSRMMRASEPEKSATVPE